MDKPALFDRDKIRFYINDVLHKAPMSVDFRPGLKHAGLFDDSSEAWLKYELRFEDVSIKLVEEFFSDEGKRESIFTPRGKSARVKRPYQHLPSGAANIRAHSDQAMLEVEGLKSQVISLRRELNTARRNEEYLQAQNEKQLEYIGELTKALRDVQGALISNNAGCLCMHATHYGVVTEVVGDEVAVVFHTEDGELEQVYRRSQFFNQELPQPGDKLEAHVLVSRSAETYPAATPQDDDNEFSGFRTKRVTGPVEI